MRLSLMAVILTLGACAAPGPTWTAGKELDDVSRVAPAAVSSLPDGSKVRIEGSVTRVCQGSGCWVEISDGAGAVIAKSFDHEVLFPKDCVGRKVVVFGVVRVDPESSCGDGGEHGKDHECPRPKVLVEVSGAKLY